MARGAESLARAAVIALLMLAAVAAAAEPPAVRDIFMYRGADRERVLAEGARKEASVVVYSTLTVADATTLSEAFERKYGVKVMAWRGNGDKIVQRAMTEARSGRYDADVFEMNAPQMEMLHREKLLEEFFSPAFADIPPAAFPPHRHYVADRFAFYVLAFNTRFVKPAEAPSSYEELLDPKWRGKLGLEAGDVAWFAAVTKAMGEEKGLAYFRSLAAMKPQLRTGHILLAELVAAGEIPMTPTAYNNNVETLKKKGAPVDWKPLSPSFGRATSVALSRRAPHPHAAALFTDFLLSREGQQILQRLNRVPSNAAVGSTLNNFRYELVDPVIMLDEWQKWSNLWSSLFLGGKAVKGED